LAAERLSTQVFSNTGERLISDVPHIGARTIDNACQEYEEMSASATAKLERKEERLELAHPPQSETGANLLEIHKGCLLKLSASRQEKTSHCNRNGAPSNLDFGDVFAGEFCGDVKTAGTQHLDALFDDNGSAALCAAVFYKPRNGWARG
jgi:hypothetical protein